MPEFKFIDLFAGIGGFRLGLERNGGKCIGFSEIDKTAIATYTVNHHDSHEDNFGDITKVAALPEHDLLTGGVPCQSWSIAGKNLGFDDDRGQLWNDTIYLVNKSRPKAFIFENVKGLTDPRNQEAFEHILGRIREAGYHVQYHVLDSSDFGIPQSRVRVYLIGFRDSEYAQAFKVPVKAAKKAQLGVFLGLVDGELSGAPKGSNDYFLFNDIRNGPTTIHSWDILPTSEKEKQICMLLLTNRRKRIYGAFDGNPLSLNHFQALDASISVDDLDELVRKGIFKKVVQSYHVVGDEQRLTESEYEVLRHMQGNVLNLDDIKNSRVLKQYKVNVKKVLEELLSRNVLITNEERYEFKFSKISTGIFGVNRVYLGSSDVFSTLVASDTNDFIATTHIEANSPEEFKQKFLEEVYHKQAFRKVTREEACLIQGFPTDMVLPERREKWMKQIGNSVSVPVIEALGKAIVNTGVFD